MRMRKVVSAAVIITFFAVLYVHQQTRIFRLAYEGQRKQGFLQELLDYNNLLRYNIEKNASLIRIGSKVLGNGEVFQMPDTCAVVKLGYPLERLKANTSAPNESVFSRIFGIKRQAEAETIGH